MSYTVFTQRRSLRSTTNGLVQGLGLAALAVAIGLPSVAHGQPSLPNTYTSPNNYNFTSVNAWNFASGPVPATNPAGTLTLQDLGSSGITLSADVQFSLNSLVLNNYTGGGTITVQSVINGNLNFSGAANITINGSGGTVAAADAGGSITTPVVLGSTATGLTIKGSGLGNTAITGAIGSSTFTGAPILIATGGLPQAGVVTLGGTNTFVGGVQLTSGNLGLTNASSLGIFGNNINTLTVTSGSTGTLSGTAAFINPVVLADNTANLVITGGAGNAATTLSIGGLLGNGVSGAGSVVVRPSGTASVENFQGINSYTGSTTVGQIQFATNGTPGAPGVLRIQGALGQLTATSGITVSDGAVFEINKNANDSVNNSRVGSSTPISLTSSVINVVGSSGFTTQSLGAVTAAGGSFVGVGATNASIAVTIANLNRSGNAVVTISGGNLGSAAAAVGVSNANVFLTQINGAAPAGALVGGGGVDGTAATPSYNVSIIPWVIGDSQNAVTTTSGTATTTFGFGSGFATYNNNGDTTGVRLLNTGAATGGGLIEYNASNILTPGAYPAGVAATDNVRITSATVTGPTGPTTINSLFVATTGATVSGTGSLTITSGALASNVAAFTTSFPIAFGAGGTGEAIVTVVGALGSGNTITANGALTGSTLTKAGGGTLVLGSASNAFTLNTITVDAGQLSIPSVANLGISQASVGASTMTFDMQTSSSLNGGLLYSGTGTETLNSNIVVNSGHAELRMTGAGGNLTFAGLISGAGAINIDPGAVSVVTLAGNNTYTGGTRLGSATSNILNISSDANFGAPTGPLTINSSGMTLRLSGIWNTSRSISIEGAFGTTAGAATGSEGFDTAGNNSTWSGPLLGNSNIFKVDSGATPGTWTIASANNPYTGIIQLGTSLHAGGILKIGATGDLNSASVQFGPDAAGVAGTYTLDLSAASVANGGTGWKSFAGIATGVGFGAAGSSIIQLGTNAAHAVDIQIGSSVLNTGTATTSFAGIIQGSGSLIKTGTGTLFLNGAAANTFIGDGTVIGAQQIGVEMLGGVLQIASDANLGDPSNAVFLVAGSFRTSAAVTTARNFVLGATPATLSGNAPDINLMSGSAAGNNLTITGNVTGPGGFEKNGSANLILTGTNTFGGLNLNSQGAVAGTVNTGYAKESGGFIVINNDTNLGVATTAAADPGAYHANKVNLLVGGGLELAASQGAQQINRYIVDQTGNAVLDVETGSTLTFSGSLVSANNGQVFFYQGAGSLVIDANASKWNASITIGNGAATGNVSVTPNANVSRANLSLVTTSGATLTLNPTAAGTRDIGGLSVASGTTLALGSNNVLTFGFNNGAQTIAGAVNGSTPTADGTASLIQVGSGTTTITSNLAASTASFNGGYTVGYSGGLTISGATGTLPLQGGVGVNVGAWGNAVNRGPVLTLDSTVAHLATGQQVNLNAAELSITGAATIVNQTIDSLNGSGYSIVTAGNTAAGAVLAITPTTGQGLSQASPDATFLFRSGSTATLGSGPAGGAAGPSNVTLGAINGATPASALIGGSGAAGSTTIPILPFAVGDDSATGLGSTFVTYGANGVRTLQAGSGEFEPNLIGAGSTENVRVNNAAFTTLTLAANQTVNSLILTGSAPNTTLINSTSNQKLIVTSGAILNAVNNVYTTTVTANGPIGIPVGIQATEIDTGNTNSNPLYVYATGGDLAIGSKITTSGGLVMSGSGSLYLTNTTNSYGGAAGQGFTTINGGTLVIDNLSAINDGATAELNLSGGFLKYRGPSAVMQSGSGVVLGGFGTSLGGGINVVSGTNLTLPDSFLFGGGGLIKDGTGILTLLSQNGGNTFTNPVIIHGGQVAIDSPLALGASNRVLFDGGSPAVAGASLKFNAPMTLTQEVDIISSSANIGAGFDTNGNNVTISGNISSPNNNSMGIYKLGAGNLTITSATNFTGSAQVFGGNLILAGPNGSMLEAGNISAASAFNTAETFVINSGTGMILDNTGPAANNNPFRLPNPYQMPSQGGISTTTGIRILDGSFSLLGNSNVASSQTTNEVDFLAGTVTLQNNGQNVALYTGKMIRSSSASIGLVRGLGLGNPLSPTSTNWFLIDINGGQSTQLGGAGGAAGTPYISIVPGFIGDQSNTGTGTDLMTYDTGVGFRLLTASEYKSTFDGTIGSPNYDDSRSPNVLIASATAAPSFATWVSAMKFTGSSALTGTGGFIVRQSTILATGNGSPSINMPVLGNFGNTGYDFYTAGTTTLTVNANLNSNNLFVYGGARTDSSSGTLVLNGAYYGNGQVFVGQGATLTLGATGSLNPLSSNVNVAAGGILNIGANSTIASINTQALVGTFNLNQVSDGTINLGNHNLTLYDSNNSVFTGQINSGGSGGALTKSFFSSGTTTITQPQPNFTGTVRVNNGTFQLASGGTLPNATLIDVRGGTLQFNNSDDNGAVGGYVAQRVSATMPINLAGNLTFTGNTNAVANHSLGTVALVGGGTINVTPGNLAPSTLTVANLTRAANHGTLTVVPSIALNGTSTLVQSGFGGTGTGWTLNVQAGSGAGSGTITADNLELTAAANSSASSAWFNTPVNTGPFKVTYTYTVPTGSAGNPADGVTFGFQNAGLTALGGGGGSLGYSGGANGAGFVAVTPSLVYQMNIFTSNGIGGAGVGIISNAAAPGTVTSTAPVNLQTFASPVNVTMTFDGTNLTTVLTQGANTSTTVFPFNLSAVGATAFMGFTGATGGLNAEQHITNFTYSTLNGNPTLGLAQAANGGSRILLNQVDSAAVASSLKGGGGLPGTTTISILPWAWSSSGSFVTYDPTNGLRPLNTAVGVGTEYNPVLNSGATSFDNVRMSTATPLSATTEVNSLIVTSGNVTGAADLVLRSGALAIQSASTIGVNTNNLKTGVGGANTTELVVFDSTNATINYNIGTSGGVTKFGGAALTLGGTNTFTGGLTINGGTVLFTTDSQLGAAGQPITFGLPTNNATPAGVGLQDIGTTFQQPVITRNFVTNSFGGIIGPQVQVTTLNGTISGTGVWAYNSTTFASVYEVNGTNTYTGDTYITGQVSILNDAALGAGQVIQMNSGASSDGIDLRANWTTSKSIQMRATTGIDTNGFNGTINGQIIGAAQLVKWNNGTLTLTAPNPVTTGMALNAGTLRLFNGGSIVVAPAITNQATTQFVLDDSGTHYSDRLAETLTFTGTNTDLQLIGNPSVTTQQVLGGLSLNGGSRVTLVSNGQPVILQLGAGATYTRNTGSSVVFRGTNLGTAAPGTAGDTNIMIFNPTGSAGALTGGGGPANNTAISIIPGAFGDTSATGNGTQLVTYDLNNGVRLLNPATEFATIANYPNGINGTAMVDNLHLTASNGTIANATTVNSLWVDGTSGGISVTGAGTLTITAGNILVSGTGNSLGTSVAVGANNTVAIGGTGDLNITGAITVANNNGLTKSGNGTLTLSGTNAYTGDTRVMSGTLVLNNAAALGGSTTLRMMGGALQATALVGTIPSTVALGLESDMTYSGSDLTIAGTVTLDNATRAINVLGSANLTLSGAINNSSASVAGIGLIKGGTGTLILTNGTSATNTSYYGGAPSSTTFLPTANGFYLSQTIVNAGTLKVNNTTGSGTGGSTVVVNSGGTLGGTGAIIPAQNLESRNTVTINSGGILSPGGSPGQLTVGSATTNGVTTATVAETTGSYFNFLYTAGSLVTAPINSGGSNPTGTATGNNELSVKGSVQLSLTTSPSVSGTFFNFGNLNPSDFNNTVAGNTYSFLFTTSTGGLAPNGSTTAPFVSSPVTTYALSNAPGDPTVALFQDLSNPGNLAILLSQFQVQVDIVGNNEYLNITSTGIPEPSSLLVTGAAAVGLGGFIRRRRKAAKALAA